MPSDSSFDLEGHLCYSDIAVDNSSRPQVIRITIKQLKTDLYRKGIDLFLGRTSADLCPVESLLTYLVQWRSFYSFSRMVVILPGKG